jgi:hypothetical protein
VASSMKKRYHSDPEYRARCLANAAEYRKRNKHRYRDWQRADRAKNPEKWRAISRKAQGLPEPTRPAPEACEICGLRSNIALCLDHCHLTNAFRGWICSSCNVGLGHFRDNAQALERAAAYLRRPLS